MFIIKGPHTLIESESEREFESNIFSVLMFKAHSNRADEKEKAKIFFALLRFFSLIFFAFVWCEWVLNKVKNILLDK